MAHRVHMRLDIRGALKNWKLRDFKGMFTHENGSPVPPADAKAILLDELAKGNLYIPVGDCDNFDPQTGCKGHEVE